MQTQLDALNLLILTKGVPAPHLAYVFNANAAPHISLNWYNTPPYGDFQSVRWTNFEKAIADVSSWPDPETKALTDHNNRLAVIIDTARSANIPDIYVTPLVAVREALNTNLLAAVAGVAILWGMI